MVQQHVEPRPGTEPLQMSSLAAPGFRDQLLTNLRRNFIIYNRAPEYSEQGHALWTSYACLLCTIERRNFAAASGLLTPLPGNQPGRLRHSCLPSQT